MFAYWLVFTIIGFAILLLNRVFPKIGIIVVSAISLAWGIGNDSFLVGFASFCFMFSGAIFGMILITKKNEYFNGKVKSAIKYIDSDKIYNDFRIRVINEPQSFDYKISMPLRDICTITIVLEENVKMRSVLLQNSYQATDASLLFL